LNYFFKNSFVGSHLVDRLMLEGHEVIVADNFFTGRKRNIEHWIGHENFELINHDIVNPLFIEGTKRKTNPSKQKIFVF
jgi:nucleoside-diphosphate-sugar epimerase